MRHPLKSLIGPILVTIFCVAQASATASQDGDLSRWRTFTSRAGWSIKYPPDWRITSCNLCPDPTDPLVFLWFYDPQADEGVRIESLQDKPPDKSADEWLRSSARVLAGVSGEKFWLDGRKALKTKVVYMDSSENETIYVVDGSNTFSIGEVKVEDTPFYQRFL